MEAWHCADAASGAASFWQWSSVVAKLKDVAATLAANKSVPCLIGGLKSIGVQHRGKPAGVNLIRALKAVWPFLASEVCWTALSLAESCCPELRDPTVLMFVANHCSAKAAAGAEAAAAPGADAAGLGTRCSSSAAAKCSTKATIALTRRARPAGPRGVRRRAAFAQYGR